MRDYGRVSPTFWTRGSGKKLRGKAHAQLVALYLFTCPAANMIGLYHLAIPTMAHETGMSVEEAERALGEVCLLGIAQYDPEEELVYLPEGAKYQIGEQLKPGDRRVKGVENALAQFGRHAFAADFIRRYRGMFCLGLEAPDAPAPHPFPRVADDPGSPFEAPSKGSTVVELTPSEGSDPIAVSPLEARPGKDQDQARQENSHTQVARARVRDVGLGNLATPEVLLAIVGDYPKLALLHGNDRWAQDAGAITARMLVRTEDAVAAVQAFLLKTASRSWHDADGLSAALGGFLAKAKEHGDSARAEAARAAERAAKQTGLVPHRGPKPQPGKAWIDPAQKNPDPVSAEERRRPLV